MTSKPKKLSGKRAAFVREYLKDLNATKAAIRAGYAERAANREGSRLLSNADVAAAIAELQRKAADRNEITVDRVLREYAAIAFAKIADFYDFGPDGVTMKSSAGIDEAKLAAVMEVSERKTIEADGKATTTVRMKLHNKNSALDALAEHLGMGAPDAKLQAIVQEMLEGIRARVSTEVYAQLAQAIQTEMGLGDLAPADAAGSDSGRSAVH